MKQENARFWNGAKMCSLADLARRFVLSVYVRVARDLGSENKKHYRKAESKQPGQVPSDLCSVIHFVYEGFLSLALTPRPFHSEQQYLALATGPRATLSTVLRG